MTLSPSRTERGSMDKVTVGGSGKRKEAFVTWTLQLYNAVHAAVQGIIYCKMVVHALVNNILKPLHLVADVTHFILTLCCLKLCS